MISGADELVSQGDEIQETIHPSWKDTRYLKTYILSAVLTLLVLGLMFSGIGQALPFSQFYLLVLLVVPLFMVLRSEIKRRFRFYHFTNRKVMFERGILNKDYTTANYPDITDVHIDKDLEERIFDVGDLHFNTAGHDTTEIVLNGVSDPERYKVIIDRKSQGPGNQRQQNNPQNPSAGDGGRNPPGQGGNQGNRNGNQDSNLNF